MPYTVCNPAHPAHSLELAAVCLPDEDLAVHAAAHQELCVRRPRHAQHPVLVTLHTHWACFSILWICCGTS